MRVTPSWRRVLATLATVLVPFGVPQEGVNAQGADGPAVRTITNIAEATWDADGSRRRVESNPVRFDVSTAPPTPPVIKVFRRSPGGGAELVYRPPSCGVVTGITITARMPRRFAASATPCAWLPAEAQITPFLSCSGVRCAILL